MTHPRPSIMVRSTFVCLLSLGLGALSCTSVLGIEDTELVSSSGPAVIPEQWACLGQQQQAQEELTVVVPVVLLFDPDVKGGAAPAQDIQIDVCEGALSVNCANQLTLPQFSQIPSSDTPAAILKIPQPRFDGYLRFTDSNKLESKDRTIEFRYYFSPTLDRNVTLPPVVLVGLDKFSAYLSVVGTQPNPDRGYLSATIFDCKTDLTAGAPLGGNNQKDPVILQTTPNLFGVEGVTGFHFRPPAPGVPLATPDAPPNSDGSGPIGFLNVAPTQYVVKAFSQELNAVVSERSVVVSAGVFSTVLMLPAAK